MVCSLFYVSTCFSYGTCLLRLPLGKPWVVRTHQSAAKDSSCIGPEQAKVGLSKIAFCFMTSITKGHKAGAYLNVVHFSQHFPGLVEGELT